jgi:hypothetical protein
MMLRRLAIIAAFCLLLLAFIGCEKRIREAAAPRAGTMAHL